MLTLAVRGAMLLTGLGTLFLLCFGKYALWLFGDAFLLSYQPMLVLLVGQIVNVACGSVGFLMMMTGNENRATLVYGVGTVLNILLNLLLIPLLGIIGAALATAMSVAFLNAALLLETRRRLGVNASILASI